ncbi:RNA polymerase subunit sigma-28 [Burkholderia multivorans]
MKTAISNRNISELARPDLKGLIGNLLDRHLQPHLSHFPAELVRLRATLEQSGHRRLYRARLRRGLPSATLTCSDESPELGKALELSFSELERQLEHHIAHLRHEDNWHRKERRAGLALFSELVRPLLPELKRFVERELAYLQARGDLAPGALAVDEVVDETLARACERLAQHPRKLEPRQWLYQIALDVLAEEVSRRQTDVGRWVSLEGRPPVQLREPHEDDDEILFEYWQPDEVLRLEDATPAADGTPEEELSAKETRRLVAALVADMPTSWRQALVLCRMEAVPRASAAQVLGTSERELERWLADADAFLKARLGELRFTPRDAGVAEDYVVAGMPPSASRLTREFDDATRGDSPHRARHGGEP